MAHTFGQVNVGDTFDYCGNLYEKVSTRTAKIVMSRSYNQESGWKIHTDYANVWGYFPMNQQVNQESYWWKSMQHNIAA